MKRIQSALLAMLLAVALIVPAVAAEYPVTVTLDGVPIQWTDAVPYIDENGRTMVPLRPVAEAMGLEVIWEEDLQMITFLDVIVFSNRVATHLTYFEIGQTKRFVEWWTTYPNGKREDSASSVVMDTVPVLKDGRTYAPLRYLAEVFFYDIEWDGASFTVALTSPEDVDLYHKISRTQDYDYLVEFFPGESYDQFYGGEIRNVTLDGAPVAFKQFSQAEIDAANTAFGAEHLSLAFAIEQPLPYGTYAITWEAHWFDENGAVKEVQEVDATYTLTETNFTYYEH